MRDVGDVCSLLGATCVVHAMAARARKVCYTMLQQLTRRICTLLEAVFPFFPRYNQAGLRKSLLQMINPGEQKYCDKHAPQSTGGSARQGPLHVHAFSPVRACAGHVRKTDHAAPSN